MGLIAENKVVENQASQDVHVLPAPFSVPPTIRLEPAGQRQQALPGAVLGLRVFTYCRLPHLRERLIKPPAAILPSVSQSKEIIKREKKTLGRGAAISPPPVD